MAFFKDLLFIYFCPFFKNYFLTLMLITFDLLHEKYDIPKFKLTFPLAKRISDKFQNIPKYQLKEEYFFLGHPVYTIY